MKARSAFRQGISVAGFLAVSLLAVLTMAQAHLRKSDALTARAAIGQTKPREGFNLTGAVDKPDLWTVARLSKEFAAEIKTVDYTLKGKKGQAKCIPLRVVLKASGPRLNPKVKNHLLAFTVFVRADDGYTACFSWGELQPEVGKRDVWLALDRDGQPIPGDDGPIELIVPGDEKPSRWVHGVSRIVVADGIALTEQTGKN